MNNFAALFLIVSIATTAQADYFFVFRNSASNSTVQFKMKAQASVFRGKLESKDAAAVGFGGDFLFDGKKMYLLQPDSKTYIDAGEMLALISKFTPSKKSINVPATFKIGREITVGKRKCRQVSIIKKDENMSDLCVVPSESLGVPGKENLALMKSMMIWALSLGGSNTPAQIEKFQSGYLDLQKKLKFSPFAIQFDFAGPTGDTQTFELVKYEKQSSSANEFKIPGGYTKQRMGF